MNKGVMEGQHCYVYYMVPCVIDSECFASSFFIIFFWSNGPPNIVQGSNT